MTTTNEPTPTPEPDDASAAPDDDLDDATLDPRARETFKKLRSENHSLRTRLRDREDELGIASARLGAHHRAVIESAARAAGLIDGSDIWSAQPDPNAFLDEQFHDVVDDKVVEIAKALIAAKPHLARIPDGPPPTDRPIEGLRPGARAPEDKSPAPTWASALRGG